MSNDVINPGTILQFMKDCLDQCELCRKGLSFTSNQGMFRQVNLGKIIAPLLINVADNGGFVFGGGGQTLGKLMVNRQPIAKESGLSVAYKCETVFDGLVDRTAEIPYPNPEISNMCRGRWTELKFAEFLLPSHSLLPDIQPISSSRVALGAHLRWELPIVGRLAVPLIRYFSKVSIIGLTIYPNYAEFVQEGSNWILPKVVW